MAADDPSIPDDPDPDIDPSELSANSQVWSENDSKPARTSIPSILDGQSLDFQLRAANGRVTTPAMRSLPDHQLPPPYLQPRSLNETVDVVARAVAQHFRIGVCACGGTEVFSKLRPWARCLRCGTCRVVESIRPTATRRRCQRCRKYFRSVTKFLKCPACQARGESEPEVSPTRIKKQTE